MNLGLVGLLVIAVFVGLVITYGEIQPKEITATEGTGTEGTGTEGTATEGTAYAGTTPKELQETKEKRIEDKANSLFEKYQKSEDRLKKIFFLIDTSEN